MKFLTITLIWILGCSLVPLVRTQEITYNIPEEEVGYHVGNLVEDLTLPTDSATRFQLLTTASVNLTYFELNSVTGDITTIRKIDRETVCPIRSETCQYELEVLVSPQSSFRFINIHVIIEDINDNAPFFSEFVLPIEVPETVAIGTKIPLENAQDPDIGINSVQEYELLNDYGGKFGVFRQRYDDNSVLLQLEVTGGLDRETRGTYLLTLLAHDGGNPSLTGSVTLNVTVLDSNDNTPQFQQSSYAVSVEENIAIGTEILKVQAVDPDWGTNGQIQYSFSSSVTQAARQVLEIDGASGSLSVIGILDHEQQASYQLIIQATNRVTNPVPDFTTVTIDIIDMNDNAPSLTVNALGGETNDQVHVLENTAIGTLIAFIKASDPDSGRSGDVRISLSNTHSDFELQEVSDGQYFIASLRALDRETLRGYNISVRAEDHGSPARSTVQYLLINVDDINDNAPYFSSPIYYTNIQENNIPPTPIVTLTATDPDEGTNSDITYHLFMEGNDFAVDPSSGVVTSNIVLDREVLSTMNMRISACDKGVPILCRNTTLVIDIDDQNDNAPLIEQSSYQFTVTENELVNSVVGYIKATDSDYGQNSQLTYAIQDADAKVFFRIVEQTGKLLTTRNIDREERESFEFTVMVSDHGVTRQVSQVPVRVDVHDANDNAPNVVYPTAADDTFFIPATAEPGFLVVSVDVSDPDQGLNSQLSFSMSSGNTDGIFGVNSAGQMITAQTIQTKWEGVHKVTVQISDGGKVPQITPLSITVVITNLDFNMSLPANVFFKRFNLTAADFGLIDDKVPHTDNNNPITTWPVITAIVLGSTVLLLLVVIILIHFKCRARPTSKQTYKEPSNLSNSDTVTSVEYYSESHGVQRKLSTDSSQVSITTSLSSIPSKNIMKWRAQAAQNGSIDSRLGNLQMTTFGSNSDVRSDTSARQTPDNDAEVQKLLHVAQLHPIHSETDAVSDNSNRSSYDSGQGDHDYHDPHHDHYTPSDRVRSSSCPRLSNSSQQGGPYNRDHYMASPNCTPECATLGHSDLCWDDASTPRRPRSASANVYSQQPIHKPISMYANRSTGYHGKPHGNNDRLSYDDYDNASPHHNTFPRNTGTNASQVTNTHQNGFNTGPSAKQRSNSSHSNAATSDHSNNGKHYRNNAPPLILSPITEDPMELTDSKNSIAANDLNEEYEYPHGNTEQVYPISTLIRHKDGTVYPRYDNYGRPHSYVGHDETEADYGYRSDVTADMTPEYY
ncbi:protocadherin-11 X-linked-like [Asterias amurensis]|uniref:protocadherin-11 X-linked-like n=1 Tax=Asterias amurensis TaxID=7602 RepID=UPI003AB43484